MNELLLSAVAGGMAGMTVDLVLYPLDTIKTRLQARRVTGTPAPAVGRGAASFYRGLLSAMAGSFPGAATFWTSYTAAKAVLEPALPSSLAFFAHGGAAGVAELAVCAVRNPFEVVKQQMQAGLHATTRDAIRAILHADGARGLYAGYGSTIARDVPFDAIQFSLYEAMKRGVLARRERTTDAVAPADLVLWENAALGSLAGAVAAAATCPLDVIKTRLMTQTATAAAQRYTGWGDAYRRIVAEEGWRSLFQGLRPRVTWISIGGAIFIGSFEELRRRLRPVVTS